MTSRYGALRYRGKRALDPRLVGRELGVRHVLQETLRRAGERVRISIEITDAVGGHNVWASTFDRAQRDVFALQDDIAVQVAEAVRGRLTGRERARLASAPTTDAEAYLAFLRGRAVIRDRTARAAALALAEYRRATARDSSFALGYAGLAHVHALAATWGWDLPGVPPDSLDPLAIRAAARALLLDSSSAESWLAAAMAERAVSPQRSLQYNQRAVTLDSTNIEALHQLAHLAEGDTAAARTEVEAAAQRLRTKLEHEGAAKHSASVAITVVLTVSFPFASWSVILGSREVGGTARATGPGRTGTSPVRPGRHAVTWSRTSLPP